MYAYIVLITPGRGKMLTLLMPLRDNSWNYYFVRGVLALYENWQIISWAVSTLCFVHSQYLYFLDNLELNKFIDTPLKSNDALIMSFRIPDFY